MNIDGKTEVYGIIGDPIRQVAAPKLMNSVYGGRKENKVLVPFHVNSQSLAATIHGLRCVQNFKGAVITMPHKTEIVKLLDEASDEVKMVGACNVIKRAPDGSIHGDLLDGKGFVQGLKNHHHTLKDKTVFLQGCGGAASAIAFSLCENEIQKLLIFNRTQSKALRLIDQLKKRYPIIDISFSGTIPSDTNLYINGTSVGMQARDRPLFPLDNLGIRDLLVADIITSPEMTCTLKEATQQGHQIQKGIAMLEGQIELMHQFMD